jgi:predicted RNA-binding protein
VKNVADGREEAGLGAPNRERERAMCQSDAYLEREGEPELLLKDVASISRRGELWVLVNLFGEKREVKGDLKLIDLMGHRVLFSESEEGQPGAQE